MFRVMIVDDEPEIRYGLRLKVDWRRLGLEVAAEASNGAEAIRELENRPVDIVITDMNMPVTDGVTFLETCRERFPDVRLIVLTGYEDFQYARAAIRSQARDYLLKPVSGEELEASLRGVVRELEEQRRRQSEEARMKWRLTDYYKQMKEAFLIRLATEPIWDEKTIRERLETFELDRWDARPVRFVAAGLRGADAAAVSAEGGDAGPHPAHRPAPFRLPFELMCREFAESGPERLPAFPDRHDPGLFLFLLPDDTGRISAFTGELGASVRKYLRQECAFGVGEPVAGFRAWREGYVSALLAWHESAGESAVAAPAEPGKPAEPSAGGLAVSSDLEQQILRFLDQGNVTALEQTLLTELKKALSVSRSRFAKTVFHLHLLTDTVARTFQVPPGPEESLWLRPELALRFDTAEEAVHFLMRSIRRLHQTVRERSEEADRFKIEAILRFIQENYMYDLNLTMLAERFHYHPSYFSELFKAKVGKSFIRYLTEVRMEKAVRLLRETSLGLWDIAELCGFSGPGYFSSKFKRMYGMSPTEFRQRMSEKFAGG